MPTKTTLSETQRIPKLRFPGFSGEWEEMKLDQVLQVIDGDRGTNYPSLNDFTKEGYCLFLNAKNVTKNGFSFEERSFISKEKDEQLRKGKLKRNDIVLTTRGSVGHISYYNDEVPFGNIRINSGMVLLRGDKQVTNPNFIYRFIDSKKIQNRIQRISFGSAQPQLTVKEINNLKLSFPSTPEQQKIAEFLGSTDDLINNLMEQKENLESYKKGMMQKIFSQEIRFKDEKGKEFPEWEENKVSNVLITLPTRNYQIKNSEILIYGKNKVVDQSMDLVAGYSNDDTKVLNDIPVIIFGDHTTIVKYIDFPFVVGADGTKILKTNKNNNLKFVYYFLQFSPVESEGYKRHYSVLKDMNINLPKSSVEQQKISEFLTSVDKVIESKQGQITEAEQWKKGLMQGLFV